MPCFVQARYAAGIGSLLLALTSTAIAQEPSCLAQPAAEFCPPCKPAAPECQCPDCAAKRQADLKKAVATAYAPVFYNNNFDYINSPFYQDSFVGDRLKQIPLGQCSTLDIGGQYRARYHGERNIRGLGLTGVDDDFLLHRTRLFMNGKLGDRTRVYAEFIDAESNYEDFAPRAIEVNRADMLNLFVDYRLFDLDAGSLTARVGRQELLYGSERLVSPLDWANTRRTFEGAKFLWQGADWNCDIFFVEPVAVDPQHFDSAVDEQEFFGMFATYKAWKHNTLDFYALQFNNASTPNDFQYTTLGSRWLGSEASWLWEIEGGVQFGENTDDTDHTAGFATFGIGKKWECHCWKPTLWAFYDWAEGDDDRGAAKGFNHLFPLAHRYLGFMDLFGRSNIESFNVQLSLQPHEKVKLLAWYYYLFLENKNDSPYNVNMSPFNGANDPESADLGHEVDLLLTYSLSPRMDLSLGYSHFFAGRYYDTTDGAPYDGDASFAYVQYVWNF